jgi:site-specific recombinase XerD
MPSKFRATPHNPKFFRRIKKFINLMKDELFLGKPKKSRFSWVLDETKYLNWEKVKKLRRVCGRAKDLALKNNQIIPARNWFMVELGLFTGLRVCEMVNLKSTDLHIQEEQSSLTVQAGKGDKPRTVYFSEAFKNECLFYLRWKEKKRIPGPYLFANREGKQLSKRTLQKAFKKCLEIAGLESHYSIHSLRHTYGSHLYKASNHNLRLVQEQLGHSSIRTTQIYASLMDEDVKKALKELYHE